MSDNVYYSNTAQAESNDFLYGRGNIYTEISTPYIYPTPYMGSYKNENNKKGDDDMRYLYEVILVNPKNDEFYIDKVVARSETSALMAIYAESNFIQPPNTVKFDDLKTSCKILMEWKKEKSLKKAIETIKKAVE